MAWTSQRSAVSCPLWAGLEHIPIVGCYRHLGVSSTTAVIWRLRRDAVWRWHIRRFLSIAGCCFRILPFPCQSVLSCSVVWCSVSFCMPRTPGYCQTTRPNSLSTLWSFGYIVDFFVYRQMPKCLRIGFYIIWVSLLGWAAWLLSSWAGYHSYLYLPTIVITPPTIDISIPSTWPTW